MPEPAIKVTVKLFAVYQEAYGTSELILELPQGTSVVEVRDRLITVGNKDGQPRITFTAPIINQARCVMFVVAGANKRPALAQVFAPVADELTYPSRLIQPQGELWWLLDRPAGQGLQLPDE